MLILLTDQGLEMRKVKGGYTVDGLFCRSYEYACDMFYGMMGEDEVVIYDEA